MKDLKIKFYVRKDVVSDIPIYYDFSINKFRFRSKTGKVIPTLLDWNSTKGEAVGKTISIVQAKKTNKHLNSLKKFIKGEIEGITKTMNSTESDKLKNKIKEFINPSDRVEDDESAYLGLYEMFDYVIEKSIEDKGKGTTNQLMRVRELLKIYEKKYNTGILTYDSITLMFYDKFVKMLKSKDLNLKISTIGIYIQNLKSVMSDATNYSFNDNLAFKLKAFKVLRKKKSDEVYLKQRQLDDLQSLKIFDPFERIVLDTFLIMSETALRLGDMLGLSSIDNIDQIGSQKFITFKEKKKKHKRFFKITDGVVTQLEKYGGKFPHETAKKKITSGNMSSILSKHVRVITDGERLVSTMANDRENLVPFYDRVSSHSARRTYCTLAWLNGASYDEIIKQSGHTTVKNLLTYVRATEEELLNHKAYMIKNKPNEVESLKKELEEMKKIIDRLNQSQDTTLKKVN